MTEAKCACCFRRIRFYRVVIMEGLDLVAEIHLTGRGNLEHYGKLNSYCKNHEVQLIDTRGMESAGE